MDTQGQIVHAWPTATNTQGAHLAPDGSVVVSFFDSSNVFPGVTGRLQKMDVDGNITWNLLVNGPDRLMHHDFYVLPNGNVLVMTVDNLLRSDALAAGRDPALLPAPNWFPETIIEIEQTGPTTGEIVWEWRSSDHFVQDYDPALPNYGAVADHPELIDINYPPAVLFVGDVHHCNGIDYDPDNDWIIISARQQDEFWLIDHSTTTAEAAGHTGGTRGRGGDLLWRWGNPEAYGRGTPADRQNFRQHDPRFIPDGFPGAGNITFFNNQVTATQSAVMEIELPLDPNGMPFLDPIRGVFGPEAPVWTYMDPALYSPFVSGAQRLENGNTLICQGMNRRLLEVSPAGDLVWEYIEPSPGGFIFQCDYVDRSMWTRVEEVSRSSGGIVSTSAIVDSSYAGHTYIVLGSLSVGGSTPLPGGLSLPFQADQLTVGMLSFPNTPLFINTLGLVGGTGRADSMIYIPGNLIDPALVGLEIELAYAVADGAGTFVKVSNPTVVRIRN